MRYLLTLAILLAVAATGYFFLSSRTADQPGAVAEEVVRFGTEGAYPPFNFIDQTGDLRGFDIEIGKALCRQAQLNCEFVAQDWDGLIPGLVAGKYEAIIASMSITDERREAVTFTKPYYRTPIRFVGRKNERLDISEEGLRGKTVGAQRATTSALFLEENYKNTANLMMYDTQENVYLDLLSGRLDAMMADAILAYDWMKTEEGGPFEFKGEPRFVDDGIGIALRKDSEELKQKLDTALQEIIDNGVYEEINNKYFPFSIY